MKVIEPYKIRQTKNIPNNGYNLVNIQHFINNLDNFDWEICKFGKQDFVFMLKSSCKVRSCKESTFLLELTYDPVLKKLTKVRILVPIPIVDYEIEFKVPLSKMYVTIDKFFTSKINEMVNEL